MNPDSLPSRLRDQCAKIRTRAVPLSDLIPLMQQAADALELAAAPQGAQPAEPVAEGFMTPAGKIVGTSHTLGYLRPCPEDAARGCKIVPLYASPADAAPVPQEVRMLTQDEREEVFNKRTTDPEGTENIAVMLQRKFCEVNAGLTIPAKEQTNGNAE